MSMIADLDDLDDEFNDGVVLFAPPAARTMPLPAYVEHQDGISQLGRLSAEAVVREYEATAQIVEAMGKELLDLATNASAMVAELEIVLKEVNEAAATVREHGKRVFLHIQNCSQMADEARKACNDVKAKLTAPSS